MRRRQAGEAPDTAMFWREQVTGLADASETTPSA
jgi:hypothetical protein